MKKFKEQEAARVKTLNNEKLFEEYVNLCQGDDYDLGWTANGEVTLKFLEEELQIRLVECGFLKEFVEFNRGF